MRTQSIASSSAEGTNYTFMRRTSALACFALLAAVSVAIPSRAQQPSTSSAAPPSPMDTAAMQLANKLVHKHEKHVIVFNFYNSDNSLTKLGAKLADNFNAALAHANKRLDLTDRSQLSWLVNEDYFDPAALRIHSFDGILAHALNLKTYIDGTISRDGNSLTITVKARDWSRKKPTASVTYSVPITPEMESLLNQIIEPAPKPPFFDVDTMKNYTLPTCVYCPNPDYTDKARNDRIQGVVILDAVVSTDGRLTDIRVLKGLPGGLTDNCLRMARVWKLVPAKGPNGKPVEVRQVVEMQFRLR